MSSHAELEDLYRRDGARLWRAVFLYARDRDVANDAVAEAFAQALRRGEAIRSPATWVWTSAFRIAAGEMHKRRHEPVLPFEDEHANLASPGAGGLPDAGEIAMDLIVAMRRLSEKQRAAVVLHYYGGYRLADVARMIGSTPGAVAVHLNRARARLRDSVELTDG